MKFANSHKIKGVSLRAINTSLYTTRGEGRSLKYNKLQKTQPSQQINE